MDKELIKIGTFSNPIDANAPKKKLTSKGIQCFVENDTIIDSTGLSVARGGVNLMVEKSDFKKAKEILDLE